MHDEGQPEHRIDRSGWPAGPWDSEPDRWEGRHAGFPVLAVRNAHLGNWCGYVGVPPGHPWRGRDKDELDVYVHGGITYCAPCQVGGPICHVPAPGEPDDVLWFGFDCIHCGDLAPGMLEYQTPGHHDGDVYRTLDYVQEQTRRLADQAAAAAAR